MVNFKLPLASIATLALLSGTSTVHGQGICQCKCTSDQSSPVYLTSQSACSTFCTGKPCPAGQSNPTGVLKQVASHVIATRYDDVNCKGMVMNFVFFITRVYCLLKLIFEPL